MKMTTVVRTCMLVMVLAVLSTTAVFGQIIYNVGAPAGTEYNGTANFNFAVNREGNKELFPAVTVCSAPAVSPEPAPAVIGGAAGSQFSTNDVFTITFKSVGSNSPTIATTGALGGNNLQVTSSASATGAVIVSANAAMLQPPAFGGNAPGQPEAVITVTITTAPTPGSGINCFTVQNLRFDIGNTGLSSTVAGPPVDGQLFTVAVTQTAENAVPVALSAGAAAVVGPPAIPAVPSTLIVNANPAGALGVNMPAPTNKVATAKNTLGKAGALGFANPTGFTTGGTTINTTNAGINVGGAAASNPIQSTGGVSSTIPSVVQNSNSNASGSISIQQNPIATVPDPINGPNLPVAAGGGLFRGFTASGPDVTTFLNTSGATNGTQAQLEISGVPAGTTVTFPATVSASSGLVVWQMKLVGSGVLTTNGTVTYETTINEGTPYSLNGALGVGASIDIPFTVAQAATGGASGVAKVIIHVGPTTAQGGTPSYNQINDVSVYPSQAVTNIGQFALFRVASNTSTRTYPYVLVSGAAGLASSYDTGIVLENTGKGTTGTNTGQDGTFTVFLIGSTTGATIGAPTVVSIASTAATIPSANQLGTGGTLAQGGIWQALASEVLKAAGVTTDWRGYVIINANFPNSSGFAFISQFANPSGGATMGYIAQ